MFEPFALATVQTGAGPAAALRVRGQLHLLHEAEPSFTGVSVRGLLADWLANYDRLKAVTDEIAQHPDGRLATPLVDPRMLTPVMYPDSLMAVGANSGHLR